MLIQEITPDSRQELIGFDALDVRAVNTLVCNVLYKH